MATRDKYNSTITCPKCKNTGKIYISESDEAGTYLKNPQRRIENLEGDFDASVYEGSRISVICKNCAAEFIHID